MLRNKRTIVSGIFIVITLIIFISLSYLTYKFGLSIVNGDKQKFDKYYSYINVFLGRNRVFNNLETYLDGKYLVILQNNRELRPSGGFMGSYAILTFEKGVMTGWNIYDIYTADGQIKGHVEPKSPLQQAFLTGDWRLPNSNWEVDFKISARDILWFFENAGIYDLKGVIGVNFELFRKWIGILGEVNVIDYSEKLNSDNFYAITQSYSEDDFFPGSHKKKLFLSAAGKSVYENTLDANIYKKFQFIGLIYKQLNDGQILIYSRDSMLQNIVENNALDGSLGRYKDDYMYSVETNLGANKANCCIERLYEHNITAYNNKAIHAVNITLKNNDKEINGVFQSKYGGNYRNYHRIIIPMNSTLNTLRINNINYEINVNKDPFTQVSLLEDKSYTVEEFGDFKSIGFWVIVPVSDQKSIYMEYDLTYEGEYNFKIKKQPGIYELPTIININDKKIIRADLVGEKDHTFSL